MNQYTAIQQGTNPSIGLAYDDNSNMIDDGTKTYAYDYANRIVEVRCKSDLIIIATYKYDALGRRISKTLYTTLLPTTYLFIYDGARCIEERNEMDIVQAAYIFGNGIDEVLTMERSGQTYYYHDNVRGSVYAVTDNTGNVVERYKYDAYGKVSFFDGQGNPISQSLISNHILYTGREYDSETGLYYYRARYYSAELGRFLQRDPLGYHDSMNLYEYVGSNPVNAVDPMGLADTKAVFPVKNADGTTRYVPVGSAEGKKIRESNKEKGVSAPKTIRELIHQEKDKQLQHLKDITKKYLLKRDKTSEDAKAYREEREKTLKRIAVLSVLEEVGSMPELHGKLESLAGSIGGLGKIIGDLIGSLGLGLKLKLSGPGIDGGSGSGKLELKVDTGNIIPGTSLNAEEIQDKQAVVVEGGSDTTKISLGVAKGGDAAVKVTHKTDTTTVDASLLYRNSNDYNLRVRVKSILGFMQFDAGERPAPSLTGGSEGYLTFGYGRKF